MIIRTPALSAHRLHACSHLFLPSPAYCFLTRGGCTENHNSFTCGDYLYASALCAQTARMLSSFPPFPLIVPHAWGAVRKLLLQPRSSSIRTLLTPRHIPELLTAPRSLKEGHCSPLAFPHARESVQKLLLRSRSNSSCTVLSF